VAEGIVELAGGLTMADTGRFLDWDGADRPY
jgi:hypothetical protein